MNSAIETKLSQLDVDKPDWIHVKFGDVAFEPKESAKDAVKEGIEHVVGLEHIKTGDIHLRHSNSIDKSTTFSKKFSPGDLLFGRRRAYLKKAAQAQFTGICSGDIIVMRAKDALMPELLPFIVNNDKFFDWAITHSAGGLSPRCKFKDLANYEFLLPPMEQQAEIAELLWAMDEVIQCKEILLKNLKVLEQSTRKKEIENVQGEMSKIDEHIYSGADIKVGKIEKSKYLKEGKYPIVDQSKIDIAGYTNNEDLVYKGDLPVLIFGDHTTNIKYIDFPFVLGADGTKVVKPKSNIDAFYVYHAIKNLNIKPEGYKRHFSILKNSLIKINIDKAWLKKFKNQLNPINEAKKNTVFAINKTQDLLRTIINQVL